MSLQKHEATGSGGHEPWNQGSHTLHVWLMKNVSLKMLLITGRMTFYLNESQGDEMRFLFPFAF
jgi:hypothetical protein